MIVLDASTKTLQLILSATADVTISGFRDATTPPSFQYEYAGTASTNTVSPAGSVTAPVNIDHVSVKTKGGANNYTLQVLNSSGAVTTILTQGVLAANETFEYTHGGGYETLTANNEKKFVMPGYLPLTGGTVSGIATFTAQPIMSSLTASLPVFSDGSKGLVSNAMTGTGNVVMSANQTLTGTLTAAIANFSGLVQPQAGLTVPTGQTVSLEGTTTLGVSGAGTTTGIRLVPLTEAATYGVLTFNNSASNVALQGIIGGGGGTSLEITAPTGHSIQLAIADVAKATINSTALTLAANINLVGSGTGAFSGFKSGSFGTAGNAGTLALLGTTSGTATFSVDATTTTVTLDKAFTAGAISGTTGVFSSGINKTAGDTGSIATATPTTIFDATTQGLWIVFAYIASAATTSQGQALIGSTNGSVAVLQSATGGLVTVTVSGTNVQVTQSTGGNASVRWTVTKLAYF